MLQTICDLVNPYSSSALPESLISLSSTVDDDRTILADPSARSSFSVFIIFFYLQMIGVVVSIIYALVLFNVQMA